jgi:hypothetical protein
MSRHWRCPKCGNEIFTRDEPGLIVLCEKCSIPEDQFFGTARPLPRVEMQEVLTDEQIETRIREAKECRAELSREGGNGDICALFTAAIKDAEAELARRRGLKA